MAQHLQTQVFLIVSLATLIAAHTVTPSCPRHQKTCEFTFTVSNVMSMMATSPDGKKQPAVFSPNGTAYRKTTCGGGTSALVEMTDAELESTVTGDGTYRMVIAINGQIPGPPVVVYEGQEVFIWAKNAMLNEALSIHFHGVLQRGTPWMDGVPAVTQCAIPPGDSFPYRFTPSTVGTHWYHAHVGTQRTEGVYGALVVIPNETTEKSSRGNDPLPYFKGDFNMILHDFYHKPSMDIYYQFVNGLNGYPTETYDSMSAEERCFQFSMNVDGKASGLMSVDSVLINGKGWHYHYGSVSPTNEGIPLEVFTVHRNHRYRFRGVHAGLARSLMVSIDNHKLHVIATDICDVRTTTVDFITIAPGERYDFYIETHDQESSGLYWIRVQTNEWTEGQSNEAGPVHVEAILRYGDSSVHTRNRPSSHKTKCSKLSPCTILNCPFKSYPAGSGYDCVPVGDLRRPVPAPTLKLEHGEYTEHFLHLNTGPARINGRQYLTPRQPLLLHKDEPSIDVCDDSCDPDEPVCTCTHVIRAPLGHVVQLVINSLGATTHPIHLHGHDFQVVKIGYPSYDETSGRHVADNSDISCLDKNCKKQEWKKRAWRHGDIEGIVEEGAVRKDTMPIPSGGYVVVRFKADNPGFWFLHCHMELHNLEGMTLVLQEGETHEIPSPPPGLPRCSSYDPVLVGVPSKHAVSGTALKSEGQVVIETTQIVIIILVSIAVCLLILMICVYALHNRRKGYARIPSGGS